MARVQSIVFGLMDKVDLIETDEEPIDIVVSLPVAFVDVVIQIYGVNLNPYEKVESTTTNDVTLSD